MFSKRKKVRRDCSPWMTIIAPLEKTDQNLFWSPYYHLLRIEWIVYSESAWKTALKKVIFKEKFFSQKMDLWYPSGCFSSKLQLWSPSGRFIEKIFSLWKSPFLMQFFMLISNIQSIPFSTDDNHGIQTNFGGIFHWVLWLLTLVNNHGELFFLLKTYQKMQNFTSYHNMSLSFHQSFSIIPITTKNDQENSIPWYRLS